MKNLVAPRLDVPVIETERLRLRGHRAVDHDDCAAMWGDPAVARFIGGRPSTREEVWGRMLRYAGLWALLGYGYWAVEDRASGDFVGDVGFADFRRDIQPPLDGVPEIGWALSPRWHGKGYASEAVAGALAWSDARFAASVCIIDSANLASVRVAQKNGFQQVGRATYRGDPTTLYRRSRSERTGVD
jgi:RimJ/RimL family protein N-acetyltransferase